MAAFAVPPVWVGLRRHLYFGDRGNKLHCPDRRSVGIFLAQVTRNRNRIVDDRGNKTELGPAWDPMLDAYMILDADGCCV
ncbi:MAG: hypothetical protein KDI72_08050, partial [Xanthomonadales bacterium]|nr:hypothetical protein [Xanthomonadales bacterium]